MALGVGIPHQFHETHSPATVLQTLPVGVWCDWQHNRQHMADPRYLPTFWTGQIGGELAGAMEVAAEFPGCTFLFGNEPERTGPESAQASPEQFAEAVETWVARFGRHNLAIPGVQLTEHGIAWLEQYIKIGGIIPSNKGRWNFKLYAGNPDEATRSFQRAHNFMVRNRVHRRIILSEFAGMTFGLDEQADMLAWALRRMANDRWLEHVIWFCSYYGNKYAWSRAFDAAGKLTDVGHLLRMAAIARRG